MNELVLLSGQAQKLLAGICKDNYHVCVQTYYTSTYNYEWKALWECILILILVCVVVQLLHQLCTIAQTYGLELIHGTERNGMELWSKTWNSGRTLQVV